MGQVSVTISGRQYRMSCEDGQEDHLLGLAQEVDRRIQELRDRVGEVGDTRLALMAAITVLDELGEATQKIERLERDAAVAADARAAAAERARATEAAIVAAFNAAAERIEQAARSLNQNLGGDAVALG